MRDAQTTHNRAMGAALYEPMTPWHRDQLTALSTVINAAAYRGRFQVVGHVDLPEQDARTHASWDEQKRINEHALTGLAAALRLRGYTVWVDNWPTEVPLNFFLKGVSLRIAW